MQGGASFEAFSALLLEARKRKFPSREAAEEYLPVCSRALFDYETGKKIPAAETVLAISEALGEPLLRRIYCINVCPIGRKQNYTVDKPEDLAKAALRLLKELQDVVNRQQSFINISVDNKIHDHERAEYLEFMKELKELKQAVEALELWTEAELETKKEAALKAAI